MDDRDFLLIAVPLAKNGSEYSKLKQRCCLDADLCVAYKFHLPALRIGTLNALMALCDDLARVDLQIEAVCKRLVSLRASLADDKEKVQPDWFSVNQMNIDTYCIKFQWDEAKYPVKTPLSSLVAIMQKESVKIDENARSRQADWNGMSANLLAAQRKKDGSLRDKDIDGSVIDSADVLDTEYLETVLVLVSRADTKKFLASYENMAAFVVPRSAKEVASEPDRVLFRVVAFRRAADDFRNACREARYVVRTYVGDAKDADRNSRALERDANKQRKTLMRWAKANFAEAFRTWTHLKGIRLFVESVLRYGPPAHYETMLLLPCRNEHKALRGALKQLYGHLTSVSMLDNDEDDEAGGGAAAGGGGEFFPYVSIDFILSLGVDVINN